MKEIFIKKPQQKRSKAKFEAVLAACPQVFEEAGYRKSTTARLALEADVSIGTLYNYFSCKEAVFMAYLDMQVNQALDSVIKTVANAGFGPRESIREFVSIGVDFAYAHRDMLKIAITEFPEKVLNPDLQESREKIATVMLGFAKNKQVRFKKRDPSLSLYIMTNIILGFQFRIVVMPAEDIDRDAMVEELAEIISDFIFEEK